MERNHSIDTLRSIAAIQVILIHISGYYINHDLALNTFGINFWSGNFVNSFSRVCVPIFVLISGKFLLGKTESYKVTFKKRGVKILLPIIFWSLIYIFYRMAQNFYSGRSLFEKSLDNDILTGRSYYHMWYMYMLIGLYLVTPLINLIIEKISSTHLWFLSIVLLLLGVALDFRYSFLENDYFFLWFINYIGYFILGYLLKDFGKIGFSLTFSIYVFCSLGIAFLTYYTYTISEQPYFTKYLSPLVIIGSILIYRYFNGITITENFLSRISKYTFGIYLVHALILDLFHHANKFIRLDYIENPILEITLKLFFCFFISLGIIFTLGKIKYLNKII